MRSLSYIRKKKVSKVVAAFMAVNLLVEIFMPTVAYALTGGPSQPETQSFEPAGTSDMVDLFTGDFNYNIPLFDLPGPNGGYPFNLAYHSGIGMDQEASWVGLGWNVNPGAINRDKRGLPDDFNGDVVTTELDMAPDVTYGVNVGGNIEVFGGDGMINADLSIYNNTYRGIGYSLGLGMQYVSSASELGLGISMDSQEGVGASASLSPGRTAMRIGIDFSSQNGMQLSLSKRGAGTASYSVAGRSFFPSFSPVMKGSNLEAKIKFGGSVMGLQGTFAVGGFFRIQEVKDKTREFDAYGYNYLERAGQDDMMDFNREKDGIITRQTPNLASPNLTFDTYMATGQGFLGSYRAHRNDVGHLHDPFSESEITGGSIGVDIGLGYDFQTGGEASVNHTLFNSGDWINENHLENKDRNAYYYADESKIADPAFEKLYYKMNGEMTTFNTDELAAIGGERAMRASLEKEDKSYYLKADTLVFSSGKEISGLKNQRENSLKRIRRNNSIQPITNGELLNASTEVLSEYAIKYRDDPTIGSDYKFTQTTPLSFNRTSAHIKGSHNAGFSCVNSDGLRYIYALPAYNKTEEEIAYSYMENPGENVNYVASIGNENSYNDGNAANIEKFFSRNITPAYSSAYLLTSVLGADYVDVTGDGPSEDDYGYWVKFNYVKTSDNYKWRMPYEGGIYLRGKNIPLSDDKVIFNYGEKEMWYLSSAETKSHIAVFKLSTRNDGRGAASRYAAGTTGDHSYKLDEISLFTKAEYAQTTPVPLKTVHFGYTYDLCGQVKNNYAATDVDANLNKGKLTLKEVWFTYQRNTRGSLSPYRFDYKERTHPTGPVDTDNNPFYNIANDNTNRWGGYRKDDDFFKTKNLSYVTQFDPAEDQSSPSIKSNFKARTDEQAAVWTLKQITLPNGGSIKVTYESDDYAYVQYKRATQMFQIEGIKTLSNHTDLYAVGDKELDDEDDKRIYFKLEEPIDDSHPDPAGKVYNDYIKGLREEDATYPLYFRIYADLRNGNHEYVTGYCDLHEDQCGVGPASGGKYTTGYITVKLVPETGNKNYHPFSLAAWQSLRINHQQLLTAAGSLGNAEAGTSDKQKAAKIASLGSVIPAAMQVFKGYRKYAFDHNWGRQIVAEKSFIRLTTPDRVKFGGGLRVKKIEYTDNWDQNDSGEAAYTYGQAYTYTITEGSGNTAVTYSSGVAQYEPLMGGDEIALRHPKNYIETLPFKTDNNLFFEYPINEAMYPGPGVGYSKVTVQSIASKETMPGGSMTPTIPTSGLVEYDFYTAKDFPVLTEETDNQVKTKDVQIPLPLIGTIERHMLYATQGYAIQLNDMHGRLKSVTNYAKNANGEKMNVPTSSVSYHYKSKQRIYNGYTVNELVNEVPALVNESINDSTHIRECHKATVIMGEEVDFFTDSRQSSVYSNKFGASLNLLYFYPWAPVPIPWPNASASETKLRTFVTNKIIKKSGILDMVTASDGQSVVKTENKLFDVQTGKPLLTVVTNNFDNPVYNYAHPAHWEYDGMGAAARNAGFKFCAKIKEVNATDQTFTIKNEFIDSITTPDFSTAVTKFPNFIAINKEEFQEIIAPGDEVIIQKVGGATKYRATLLNNDQPDVCESGSTNTIRFHYTTGGMSISPNDQFYFTVVRSGRRNLLSTEAGSITALQDPTDNANRGDYSGGGTSHCLAFELADFLNGVVAKDPGRILHDGDTIGIPKNLYPTLGNIFNQVTVGSSMSCGLGIIQAEMYFRLTFTYINESGTCSTVTCDCISKHSGDLHFEADPTTCTLKSTSAGGNMYSSLQCLNNLVTTHSTTIKDVVNASSSIFKNLNEYDDTSSQVNLYANGKLGVWKPFVNYYYKDERVNQRLSGNVRLSHDGVYKGNNPDSLQNDFYLFTWKPTLRYPTPENWTYAGYISRSDKNGNTIETGDIHNIYSGIQYAYNDQLPVIRARNAKWTELFFESFEESSPSLYENGSSLVATPAAFAHSGKKSLYVTSGEIKLNHPGLLPFKEYVISLWTSRNDQPVTYANGTEDMGIELVYLNSGGTEISTSGLIRPSGNVIEKWQRITETFDPPNGTKKIAIRFKLAPSGNPSATVPAYFDDIRIIPFNATASSSVYDPYTFRLVSTLDDDHFATYYYYDGEGKLFMTKKETVSGVKTISETRTNLKQ